jgi:hypothetical protein
MPNTPDWKEKAEIQYKSEREDVRDARKSGFFRYIILLVVVGIVFGVIHLAEWMFDGGSLIPSGRDVAWASGGIVFTLAGGYLSERYEEEKSIREQRLVRIELKIDAVLLRYDEMLAKHDEMLIRQKDLHRDVQRMMSDAELRAHGLP